MSDKLVIIDGNSIFYRSFYALPLLSNSRGEYSNAIYGFAIQVLNIISNISPKYMVVAFDASKKTFRNDIFDGYKATRKPMPDELRSQIEPLKKMLTLMNITYSEKQGLEGDDIIGILSNSFEDVETIIVTGDRDSFQLVKENVKVYFTKKGTSEVKIMGVQELKNEYGVSPNEFIDVKALQGDSSDNIPGASGVGPKTATDLIVKYGNIENLYEHLDDLSPKLREKLEKSKDMVMLSKQLSTIVKTGDLGLKLDDLKFDYPFKSGVKKFFEYYEFKKLLKNDDCFLEENDAIQIDTKEIKTEEELKNVRFLIEKSGKFAFFLGENLVHLGFSETEYIVKFSFDLISFGVSDFVFFETLKPLFEDKKIQVICHNSKQIMETLSKYGIELENYFDVGIAKYLVDGVPVNSIEDVFLDRNLDGICVKMLSFAEEYRSKIFENKLQFLFEKVETPLSKVLFSMQSCGFKVDENVLLKLKEKYRKEQDELSFEIISLAGEDFNLNSPKQLSKILYEKLELPHTKKMSTDADHLEQIADSHPIVSKILRYRKVSKFLSTYIDGFLPHIDKNGFVHTNFNQTLTTTGRLSSTNPNLQNIPIRSEESREIRSMFVASSENNVLIDADYSQIELRLLAHLSGDEGLIDAFKFGIDIHTKTASEVFGVPAELVTPEMRRTAKVVNFGIIYGISEYGLADDLKISPWQAKKYIEEFYQMHPAVKKYMEGAIEGARETGKAVTLFGRSRKMIDINASNYMIRTRAERASQNMPLQGTAADIIKIAMVGTFNALESNGLKAKLIMQVHDELIVDCPKEEETKVKEILKEQMENATSLAVPLVACISSSYRWSDGH